MKNKYIDISSYPKELKIKAKQVYAKWVFNGQKYKTLCDVGVKPLIEELNSKGFVTKWSCAGHGNLHERNFPYLVFKCEKQKNKEAISIVANFWKDKALIIDEFNRDSYLDLRIYAVPEEMKKDFLEGRL